MNSRMTPIDARMTSVTWVAACLGLSLGGFIHEALQYELIPGEGSSA